MYQSSCYCTNIRRSSNAISAFYDNALKETGLTAAQYYLLINLSRLGSVNITQWAEQVGLERSTMVRNIRPLQAHGLIQQEAGHGKVFVVSAKGKNVLEQAIPKWETAQVQISEVLGKEDSAAVLRISEKLQQLGTLQDYM